MLPGADAIPTWVDLFVRLSKAPFISIASIRGRTRGGGNELSLACDLRYASREKAVFGQPEVGTGVIPGGGGSERLPRLIGISLPRTFVLANNVLRWGMGRAVGCAQLILHRRLIHGW